MEEVPKGVVPSRKVIVPVAVEGWTAALRVIGWSAIPGLTLEVTLVVVGTRFTVCTSTADVLPEKFASPLYVAEMACEPTARPLMVNCTRPPLGNEELPSELEPSSKVTVPVGGVPLEED